MYYSKSPTELEKDFQRGSEKSSKSRRHGQVILFVDIILVMMVLFYLSAQRDIALPLLERPNASQHTKEFNWQGWRVAASCEAPQACTAQLIPEGSIAQERAVIKSVEWSVREGEEMVVREKSPLGQGESHLKFETPFKMASRHKAFIRFLGEDGTELLSFRVFP